MTRPVGSVFKYNSCAIVVVEDKKDTWEESCCKCVFHGKPCVNVVDVAGDCDSTLRRDKKTVHFEQYGVDW